MAEEQCELERWIGDVRVRRRWSVAGRRSGEQERALAVRCPLSAVHCCPLPARLVRVYTRQQHFSLRPLRACAEPPPERHVSVPYLLY